MSIIDIKRRLKTIKNIKKITKAMGLVSTTKLQKMRIELDNSRGFFLDIKEMSHDIFSEFYSQPKEKNCVILISSDRGLCGSYNINVSRYAIDLYKQKSNSKLIAIGNCGVSVLKKNNIMPDNVLSGLSEKVSLESVKNISDMALELYKNGYEIYLVYTKFFSAVSFKPVKEKILPLGNIININKDDDNNILKNNKSDIIFEPDESAVIDFFVPNYINFIIFEAVLEAAVCEQNARMLSMNAATDNADEMISNLNLECNRVRQNQITQELLEIISGANALKNNAG